MLYTWARSGGQEQPVHLHRLIRVRVFTSFTEPQRAVETDRSVCDQTVAGCSELVHISSNRFIQLRTVILYK